MSRGDVHKFLLSVPRIAARFTEILGHRLADLEQRLSDSVFKTVPLRIATTLTTLATRAGTPVGKLRPGTRHPGNSSPLSVCSYRCVPNASRIRRRARRVRFAKPVVSALTANRHTGYLS